METHLLRAGGDGMPARATFLFLEFCGQHPHGHRMVMMTPYPTSTHPPQPTQIRSNFINTWVLGLTLVCKGHVHCYGLPQRPDMGEDDLMIFWYTIFFRLERVSVNYFWGKRGVKIGF